MRSKRSIDRGRKIKKKVYFVFSLLLVGFCCFFFYNWKFNDDLSNDKGNDVKFNLGDVKNNFSHYVKINNDIELFSNDKKSVVGKINKDSEIVLDENYDVVDEFFKLDGIDYYVKYDNVSKIDVLREIGNNEYGTYKNFVSYNSIVTNDEYKLYVNDLEYYVIRHSDKYDVLINDDDKYGIVFNNRLVYIKKSDVREVVESNLDASVLNGLPVLNYHYTVNREAGELNECTQTICMEDTQVEEEIKYLFDNGYYAMTMRDVYLFLTGKVKFPKKSVAITIDDGWYVSRMISILEKYKMMGTLFLIGSLASPNDYRSDYLEIHSHSWNMHTPGVCSGSHGGAILCWDKSKILDDLKKSRDSLNNTTVYCFPFYEYNDRVIEYLKEAGFEMAFIGGDKKAYVGDNLFKIHRYELVNYTDMRTFISYVSNT